LIVAKPANARIGFDEAMKKTQRIPDDFEIRPVAHPDLEQVIALVNREILGGVNIFRLVPLDGAAAERWWRLHGAGRYQAIVAAARSGDEPNVPMATASPPDAPAAVANPSAGSSVVSPAALSRAETVLGWATFVPHSQYEGYHRTADLSVWVDSRYRGRGIGKGLVQELLASCLERNLRTIVSRIESNNLASIRLHESCGFSHAGLLRDVGEKFDQSLHVVFMQYHVPT